MAFVQRKPCRETSALSACWPIDLLHIAWPTLSYNIIHPLHFARSLLNKPMFRSSKLQLMCYQQTCRVFLFNVKLQFIEF